MEELAAVAAFVGMALLQGAISYVGGKVMSNALGDPTIIDVRAWIQNAVQEIEAFVSAELRRQLDEKVLEQMRADLQGVITNIYQYASLDPSNRSQNRYLLETCDVTTARLLPLSLNYDQALFVTTTAMAYRLFTLQGVFELDNDPGHIRSARPTMDDFVTRAVSIRDGIAIQMSPDTHFKINCTIRGEFDYSCIGLQDGNPITPPYHAPPTINGRDSFEVMRASIRDRIAPLTIPMQKRHDDFLNAANKSLRLAIECYDDMCKKVGETYSPPKNLPPIPTAETTSPALLVMPGAIIARAEAQPG